MTLKTHLELGRKGVFLWNRLMCSGKYKCQKYHTNHLYGGARGHFPGMYFTPSSSQFSVPERGTERGNSFRQYEDAKLVDTRGPDAGHIYKL
jgi:hypothetical protein